MYYKFSIGIKNAKGRYSFSLQNQQQQQQQMTKKKRTKWIEMNECSILYFRSI